MRTKQGILELPAGDDSDGFAFDDE